MIELGPYQGADATNVVGMISQAAETEKQRSVMATTSKFMQQGKVARRIAMPYIIGWSVIAVAITLFLMSIHGAFVVLMCFVGMFGYVGVGILAAQQWQGQISKMMDFPTMLASNDHPKVLESIDVTYRHTFHKDTTIETLKIQLVLREWVRYTRGTDTHTETRDIVMDEASIDMEQVRAGQTVEKSFTLTIPEHAYPTWIMAANNKLTWMIKLDVDLPGWLDYKDMYGIVILPEVQRA
jgi:hypothetical protein